MQNSLIIDSRLGSAIPYLKRGGCVADIGTDHAYLPIYLVKEGISSRAVACDVNEGPIRAARANIEAAGLSHRIDTLLTDGLCGVEKYAPDDILIFGMGGELIARILSDAPWIKREEISLVLQPMTKVATLRAWLAENGFAILGETVTKEEQRFYQTIYARWSGEKTEYTAEELLLGKRNIEEKPLLLAPMIKHEIRVLEGILEGKAKSRLADTREEEGLLKALKKRLEELS